MNSEFEAKNASEGDREELSVIASIKKIQKHLVFLEKKIDTLLEQSKGRSFNRSSNFSPNRGSNFPSSHKQHGHFSRSDNFNQKRRFEKPWRGDSRGGAPRDPRGFRGGQFNRGRNTSTNNR